MGDVDRELVRAELKWSLPISCQIREKKGYLNTKSLRDYMEMKKIGLNVSLENCVVGQPG